MTAMEKVAKPVQSRNLSSLRNNPLHHRPEHILLVVPVTVAKEYSSTYFYNDFEPGARAMTTEEGPI